jgi:hypothetical protein
MLVDPIRYDMTCHRRVEFRDRIVFVGEDWSSATFRLQVRPAPDATGTPIWDLSLGAGLALEYAGTNTVANHIAAGWLGPEIYSQVNDNTAQNYVATDSILISVLGIIVSSTGTIFPDAQEAGDNLEYAYDVIVDRDGAGGGFDKQKRFYGKFIVVGTVFR